MFTYIPQNSPGFSGTVRDLLTYGLSGVTDGQIQEVLEKTGADETVALLGGLDYQIGTGGSKLSGGQKQKLSIARALLSQTEYVLLDEITSALDINATLKLQNALDESLKGRTMILVAHNLRTIQNADKIIVFSEGKVVDEGTNEELLGRCALYQELVAAFNGGAA